VSGVGLQFSLDHFAEVQRRVSAVIDMDKRQLMDRLGAEAVTQIQRRIADEKTSPDGVAWPAWSDAYAATRHAGHSLLQSENHLLQSMTHVVEMTGKDVDVGTNLIYAAIQNFGGAEVGKPGLPAREYMGFSQENRMDLAAVASDWLDQHLQGRVQ
jgi:phage virion morphogenesis protein